MTNPVLQGALQGAAVAAPKLPRNPVRFPVRPVSQNIGVPPPGIPPAPRPVPLPTRPAPPPIANISVMDGLAMIPTLGDIVTRPGPEQPGARDLAEVDQISAKFGDLEISPLIAKRTAPTGQDLTRLHQQVQSALRDNAWTPEERRVMVDTYKRFASRLEMGDPEVRDINNWSIWAEYRRLLAQEKAAQMDNRDMAEYGQGGFFDTYKGPLTGSDADYFGPGFIVAADERGYMYISDIDDLVTSVTGAVRNDPQAAAATMTQLAAWQAYGAGSEKFVANRIQFDAHGNPVKGNWAKDDQAALKQFLTDVALMQASGDKRPWDEILSENAGRNAEIGATPGYAARGTGGGGGYGGGGANTGISYTAPDLLKQLLNGVARARLGQVLPDADVAAFIADYHQKEAAFVNARMGGLDGTQLDPESAAAAWIESRFRDQMASQAGNSFIMELTQFLMGGGMSAGS